MNVPAYIDLEANFTFGKHINKPVYQVIQDDPGYLLWLRNVRWKAERESNPDCKPGHVMLDLRIHELLDTLVRSDKTWGRKYGYKPFREEREMEIAPTALVSEEPAVAVRETEDWGSW